MDIVTTIINTVIWMLIITFVFIAMGFFLIISKYKHKVTIRMDTGTGKRVKRTIAKELKDGKWQWLWEKKVVVAPPSECVEINDKGKLHVDCYLSKDGEVSYRNDPWIFREIPDSIKQIKKDKGSEEYQKALNNWRKENNVIESEPLTPAQKQVLIEQERKREEWKRNGFMQQLPQIVSVLSFVVIIALLLVFYSSIAEPSLEMGDKMASITAQQSKITETQQEILSDMNALIKGNQIIDGEDIIKSKNGGSGGK